ncbi:MBL fold metallo-hydrolase [Staphylococcus shinii]|uniref:Metal-dependent hydrolase n=1 Tax=Staphylococcus shinii TaxID=2912228 RepID=A0A418IJ46_9STAP|nr:MBL fold metallo-hydrolase [Staphylococcus shinii]MDW8565642.1 MBL fold metallo-hydrolase [Staphylococcus shinii]RIN03100.1 metal-dependent hydrolase [Staphylococcus shinii]RIN09907.1 metal-dependent hydrolase [Staphylococcus shinii]
MKIEFLGTAGGVPSLYKSVSQHKDTVQRTGPAIYIHDLQLLIDTSEDIFYQLRRSQIYDIKYGLYSHWHPDHTMGLRIWETLNYDFINKIPQSKMSKIYITKQQKADFKKYLGHWDHLNYLSEIAVIEKEVLENNSTINIKDVSIEWVQLAEEIAFGFYIIANTQRILIIPDEIKNYKPSQKVKEVDVAILPFGSNEVNPVTHERILEAGILDGLGETRFDESVALAREINAKHTYFTHIEATESLNKSQLMMLEQQLKQSGLDATIAYDGLIIQI